jgi:hypothetical protein
VCNRPLASGIVIARLYPQVQALRYDQVVALKLEARIRAFRYTVKRCMINVPVGFVEPTSY